MMNHHKTEAKKAQKESSNKGWLKSGLYFGLFVFVSMEIIYPLIVS